MEIRILNEMEIPQAVFLARGIYDSSIRGTTNFPQMDQMFEEYVTAENLGNLVERQSLTIWGAFQQNQMVAVSAMQKEGHITMLYVLPYFRRSGCGRELIRAMRQYAMEQGQLRQITVNAMPSWSAGYFSKQGFRQMNQTQNYESPFLSMEYIMRQGEEYPVKKIPDKVFIGIVLGFLGMIFLAAIGILMTGM